MKRQVIIGLVGAKGAGKSTFADAASAAVPELKQLALANKLKDASSDAFYVPREYFDDVSRKEAELRDFRVVGEDQVRQIIAAFGFLPTDGLVRPHVGKILTTPRAIAQYVGTEILRDVDPYVHCHGLMQDAPKDDPFIVTDIRFPNELEFFQRLEGVQFFPVYVSNVKAEAAAAQDPHPSERHLRTLAATCLKVENEGTIEDLQASAVRCVKVLLGDKP